MTDPRNHDEPAAILRWPYAVLAYVFVGLGLVGVVVPGLPTTIFLIMGAWAASRGSRRLHDWLYDHPRFGPSLVQWRDHRAVSARAKVSAMGLMTLSWIILWWRGTDPPFLLVLALLFAAVSAYLLSRPNPSPDTSPRDPD